jgi:hypothetical protein
MTPDGVENQNSDSCCTGEYTFSDTEREVVAPKSDRDDNLSIHSTAEKYNQCFDDLMSHHLFHASSVGLVPVLGQKCNAH